MNQAPRPTFYPLHPDFVNSLPSSSTPSVLQSDQSSSVQAFVRRKQIVAGKML